MESDPGSTKRLLKAAFDGAVRAAEPGRAIEGHLPDPPAGRLVILAIGKAALSMAQSARKHYMNLDIDPEAIAVMPAPASTDAGQIEVLAGGHPFPDAGSVAAGRRALTVADSLGKNDLLLALVSGGASALATVPQGISLERLAELTRALLQSGAGIRDINTIRRKLCALKGGGLAIRAAPATVVGLLVSDVVGDDPAAIGSGPTVPDPETAETAAGILERFAPAFTDIRALLQEREPQVWQGNAETHVVAGGSAGLEGAAAVLSGAGYRPCILSDSVEGDSAAAALEHSRLVPEAGPKVALLSGGETTVTIPPGVNPGSGGRNSHYALALAVKLWGMNGIACLAADTDGIDGFGRAAGAMITPGLFRSSTLDEAEAALAAFESHSYFAAHGHQLVTGPTGTNVNDLRMILTGAET